MPCRPSRRASCRRSTIPSRAPVFVSPTRPDAGLGPGVFGSGNSVKPLEDGNDRDSQVPGEPWCAHAVFSDPGRTTASCHNDAAARPPFAERRRLPARGNFGAQSHGLGTGCLRFAPWVTRTGRKTRFRSLARLSRAGLVTRRVPTKGFRSNRYISSPFPKLSWRNVSSFFR